MSDMTEVVSLCSLYREPLASSASRFPTVVVFAFLGKLEASLPWAWSFVGDAADIVIVDRLEPNEAYRST